ncbi:hypothetical protein [Azospirillum rugosum]|uniref:RNA ligase n=1 Tax=Azospirillum rugosum TaxID=416170 RepID=A0ABS4SNT9_9PROT|nr:hypothetical protein [Azospirillum rugosum]MBP2293753.1 hypothetical protein [Azospirillum rugosum]MDQ0527298.1 hypothetical protein [Azospirillum rugosum]
MPPESPKSEFPQPESPSADPILKLGDWNRPAAMPDGLAAEVAGWRFVLKSPAAPSFYSKPGTPWASPPEGCLRAADQWNLFPTDQPVENGTHWTIARFDGGVWRVERSVAANRPAAVRDLLAVRAERLLASRRWTRNDLDLLQILHDGGVFAAGDLLAGDEARARSLRSLKALRLAFEVTEGETTELPDAIRSVLHAGVGPALWMDEDGKAVAAEILDWHVRKQTRTAARTSRGAQAKERGETVKQSVADSVQRVFPGIPKEAAAAAAARLAPSVDKLGRMPAMQAIVDAVAETRLERWRQAVASEPEVAKRMLEMQMRGDAGRARKRYRDQRAADRVEAELRDWRGTLGPVTTRRLGG